VRHTILLRPEAQLGSLMQCVPLILALNLGARCGTGEVNWSLTAGLPATDCESSTIDSLCNGATPRSVAGACNDVQICTPIRQTKNATPAEILRIIISPCVNLCGPKNKPRYHAAGGVRVLCDTQG
jgi:hypothetical protein